MTPREIEEFRELRATIRERGTARAWLAFAGLAAWAALALATAAFQAPAAATLVPLLVLASAFEVVFSLHTGTERVGRYIQVFFEEELDGGANPRENPALSTPPGWEGQAMAYGRRFPGGTDPLFRVPFLIASVLNLALATAHAPVTGQLVFIGGTHALFAARVVAAARRSARQRQVDLERFRELRRGRTQA